MTRSYLPAVGALSALTAVALLAAAFAVRPPGLPAEADGSDAAANREVAYRFYEAANVALATGDLGPLATVVAPDLLAAAPEAEPGQPNLVRRLLALRATVPTLRLTVEDLVVDGDLALARIGIAGVEPPVFLGLRVVEQPVSWGPVDVLRIGAGRIVEHRDGGVGVALLEPALTAPFNVPSDANRVVFTQRITLDPGAEHVAGAVDGPRLLHVEAGTVAVAPIPIASDAAPESTLTVGEHRSLRPNLGHLIRNLGEGPAMLLDVYAFEVRYALQPPGVETRMPDDGVAARALAGGLTTETPGGPVLLSIGRATLAPGARLAWEAAAGPVLLHVEAGAVGLDPGAGVAWVRDGDTGRSVTLGSDSLAAGSGVLVGAGNAAELRAGPDAPATVLMVTLLPADDPASPSRHCDPARPSWQCDEELTVATPPIRPEPLPPSR